MITEKEKEKPLREIADDSHKTHKIVLKRERKPAQHPSTCPPRQKHPNIPQKKGHTKG